MKILVIDDATEIHEMLKIFFQSMGHSMESAYTGEEGLKKAVTNEPDAIFLDIKLPDRDGLEILKDLKEINKKIPVVMITGYKEAEVVIDAFRLGAFDCLLKPFNFEYIKNLLPKLVR